MFEALENKMYNPDIAIMIKIEQMGLFRRRLEKSAAEIGLLFKEHNVFGFIDDMYEFLHIQGALATFDDIYSYLEKEGFKP